MLKEAAYTSLLTYKSCRYSFTSWQVFSSCRSKNRWKDLCAFRVFPTKCSTVLQLYELVDDYIQQEIKKPPKQSTCTVSIIYFNARWCMYWFNFLQLLLLLLLLLFIYLFIFLFTKFSLLNYKCFTLLYAFVSLCTCCANWTLKDAQLFF